MVARSLRHPSLRLGVVLVGLGAFTLGFSPTSARADTAKPPPRTSSLSWIRLAGADECVSTQELARDVEGRLGRAVFVSPAKADVSVEGHIARAKAGSGWTATITLRDAAGALLGTRELSRGDASCAAMREPIALVIAVMIDPDATVRAPKVADAEPAKEPLKEPVKEPVKESVQEPTKEPVPPPPAAAASPPPPRPWHFDAGASLIGGAGLLPNFGLGIFGGGLLEPPGFVPLQAFGSVWFDNAVDATPPPGRATFSLMLLGAGICPLRSRGQRVTAYACVNGELAVLTSRGSGFAEARPDELKPAPLGALEGRLTVRVIGPIALRGGVAAHVPLVRDTFVVRRAAGTTAELFRLSSVAITGDLGFGVALP